MEPASSPEDDDHQFAFAALSAAEAFGDNDAEDDHEDELANHHHHHHAAVTLGDHDSHSHNSIGGGGVHFFQSRSDNDLNHDDDDDDNVNDVDVDSAAADAVVAAAVAAEDEGSEDMDVVEALEKVVGRGPEDDDPDHNPLRFDDHHNPVDESLHHSMMMNGHHLYKNNSMDDFDDAVDDGGHLQAVSGSEDDLGIRLPSVSQVPDPESIGDHHNSGDDDLPLSTALRAQYGAIHPGDPVMSTLGAEQQLRSPTSSTSTSVPPPHHQPQEQQYVHHPERPALPQHLRPLPPPSPSVPDLANPICRICGQGNEEGRPLLRFLPVPHDSLAARAAPRCVTFAEDVCLHIFCGKTASILSSVNRPDLEILTKAGLKNKHGIGPEVNAALARTRSAILLHAQNENNSNTKAAAAASNNKEKQYFLVGEFEAHLFSIRHNHIRFAPENHHDAMAPALAEPICLSTSVSPNDPFSGQDLAGLCDAYNVDVGMDYASLTAPEITAQLPSKTLPIKANAGQIHKNFRRKNGSLSQQQQLLEQQQQHDQIPHGAEVLPDGKVRCPCGGTHLPLSQQRGAQSWRNHIMTKRHQKWMEEQGLVGAV